MWISFLSTCIKETFSRVGGWCLWGESAGSIHVDLVLRSLFWFHGLGACFHADTMWCWLLCLCSLSSNHRLWCLQFCPGVVKRFWIFCASILTSLVLLFFDIRLKPFFFPKPPHSLTLTSFCVWDPLSLIRVACISITGRLLEPGLYHWGKPHPSPQSPLTVNSLSVTGGASWALPPPRMEGCRDLSSVSFVQVTTATVS